MTPKGIMLELLYVVAKIMKARCEQTYEEIESDKWSKNHDSIFKDYKTN